MALDAEDDRSDEMLLVHFGQGEPVAAAILTRRLAPIALRVAFRMLGDMTEAEDVAQEAMLRLWKLAPDWREEGAKVSTWMYRVVANLATDRIRRRRSVSLESVPEPEDPAPGPVGRMIDADRADALEQALLTLPERQRQAVMLRHLEQLGNPEIADIMDVGVEAVESLISRGKRGLTRALAGRRAELGYGDA